MALSINPHFQSLLIPLTPEELEQLEANILADGIRDPLVTWKDQVIDGHNRFEIAERNDLKYQVVVKHFKDDDEAEEWILLNQLGRRNITPAQAAEIRGKLFNGASSKQGQKSTSGQIGPKSKREIAGEIAQKTGVSEHTVRRDGAVTAAKSALVEPLRKKADAGELTRDEITKLAKKPKGEQQTIARDVRVGKVASFAEALGGGKPQNEKAILKSKLVKTLEAGLRAVDDLHGVLPNATKHDVILNLLRESIVEVKGDGKKRKAWK